MIRPVRDLLIGATTLAVGWAALHFGNDVLRRFESSAPSRSRGGAADGTLENGKRLPSSGANFRSYSRFGSLLGRTCVHQKLRDTMLAAYRDLAARHPKWRYVFGETGWCGGGRFRPHRTHRNGLSVDFMVPVLDAGGRPTELSTMPWNLFGYGIDFDDGGVGSAGRIDFAAMAAHLDALRRAAAKHGLKIRLVILEPPLHEALGRAPGGKAILAALPFLKTKAWIRHDEHYHVELAETGNGKSARSERR